MVLVMFPTSAITKGKQDRREGCSRWKSKAKKFFFEKKNQKTFARWRASNQLRDDTNRRRGRRQPAIHIEVLHGQPALGLRRRRLARQRTQQERGIKIKRQ
jgi:hypothetical protein